MNESPRRNAPTSANSRCQRAVWAARNFERSTEPRTGIPGWPPSVVQSTSASRELILAAVILRNLHGVGGEKRLPFIEVPRPAMIGKP